MTQPRSIAYLGNSLTVQKAGYRPALHQRLQQRWGMDLQQVNAALGGVGSLACASLLDLLVVRHAPSLCLIECSAADMRGATQSGEIGPSVETIVRDLIAAEITPLLLHLPWRHCTAERRTATLQSYEAIAVHYGIGSLSLWDRWIPHDGALLSDGQHLSRQGGEEVAELIGEWMETAIPAYPRPGSLPPPLHQQRTQWLATPGHPHLSSSEGCHSSRFRLTLPTLELPVGQHAQITPPPGEQITGLLVVADNAAGVVELRSNHHQETVQIRDQWCNQPRIQMILLDPPVRTPLTLLMTAASHADRDCRDQPPAQAATGTVLRLIGAAITGTRPESAKAWWQQPDR
jgi:hypothetical protein